ncbi:hypothetical protein EAI_17316 [Harpegnathos saltator]|uniref:Uncharacterized protein n=1 Tax=Harpegnathos saltator TaxID=610380 RepID=E2BH55_HARSA|nr:hypothetical protein EAI_17316 [Harpegnathos saltator]
MTAICFVCNLPILSHQVGLIWQGGNGWDDLVREQVEESTLKQRLGTGRRDSAAQITSISPPDDTQESSPTNQRRRRSSLAQLTDILREWSGGGASGKSGRGNKLCRRETLADIAKSLPWSRQTTTDASHLVSMRKRRESSVDSGIRSQVSAKSRRDSAISDFKNDLARLWSKKDAPQTQPPPTVISPTPRRGSGESRNSRRGSGESLRSRRDSMITAQSTSSERKHNCRHHRRRQSQQSVDGGGMTPTKYYRNDQRPSASSTDSAASNAVREHLEAQRNSMDRSSSTETKTQSPGLLMTNAKTTVATSTSLMVDSKTPVVATMTESRTSMVTVNTSVAMPTLSTLSVDTKAMADSKYANLDASVNPPTIVMSSVTPPAISPTVGSNLPLPGTSTSGSSSPVGSPNVNNTPTHPLLSTRRDSTTQCYYKGKEVSPNKLSRLTRQQAAIDESMPPAGRRGSQPTLLPDPDDGGRKARRDSLSPDSASYPRRRDSKSHLSPDRNVDKRDISPIRQRKARLRRQSTSMAGRPPRSPDSSSCSSRDPSPCARAPSGIQHAPIIRRQSTTEEILIARGFRRQSTTEEMIRCRNFRRQSSQSDDTVQRYRGRRDSSAQITDGTFATMTVETSSTFFDSSTQTGE